MRRVPYHQCLFDLLGHRPRESAAARDMIAGCERDFGRRLPESLRQWYTLEGVVPLTPADTNCIWRTYSNGDYPMSLESVLRQVRWKAFGGVSPGGLSTSGRVCVLSEKEGGWRWYVPVDGGDDPPVWIDEFHIADRFSAFVFDWFAFYADRVHSLPAFWAFAPNAAPAAPPHIDYLIDRLGDPHVERADETAEPLLPFAHGLDGEPWPQASEGGVTRYVFTGDTWRLCVTTDAYDTEGGVSAWWLAADTEAELGRLAQLAAWAGDVGEKLRRCPAPEADGKLPTVVDSAPTFSPAWLRWETDPVEACVGAVAGGGWR